MRKFLLLTSEYWVFDEIYMILLRVCSCYFMNLKLKGVSDFFFIDMLLTSESCGRITGRACYWQESIEFLMRYIWIWNEKKFLNENLHGSGLWLWGVVVSLECNHGGFGYFQLSFWISLQLEYASHLAASSYFLKHSMLQCR